MNVTFFKGRNEIKKRKCQNINKNILDNTSNYRF